MRKINDKLLLELLDKGMQQKEVARLMNVSPAAVCKRVKRLRPEPLPESFSRLTPKKQRFVLEKAEGKSNTAAAEIAFDTTNRKSAKVIGCQLMADPDVQKALADLLFEEGIGRRRRVQRLREMIEHPDPNIAIKGLDQSWRLDGYGVQEQKSQPVQIFISASLAERLNEAAKLVYRDVGDSEPLQLPVGDDGETERDQEAQPKDSDG